MRDIDIQWKIAQCYIKLKDVQNAVSLLEKIPDEQRTVEMNVAIGRIYHENGAKTLAISSYIKALKQFPLAIEILLALIELGQTWEQLKGYYPGDLDSLKWLQVTAIAHASEKSNNHTGALTYYEGLMNVHPENLYLLEKAANCYVNLSQTEKAITTFQKIRSRDSTYSHSMDIYALLLKRTNQMTEVNKLSLDLIKNDPKSPEAWASVAIYLEMKGKKEKALKIITKAISLDPSHHFCYLLKGSLLLSLGLNAEAVTNYKKARTLNNDFNTIQGLVQAHLAANDLEQALTVMTETIKIMSRNPKALTLYGNVLIRIEQGRSMARKVLEKALLLDNKCVDAVVTMAQLDMLEDKPKEALALLEKHLKVRENDMLHTRMAEVLAVIERYDEAMDHFQRALSLNPNCEMAKFGMEKLELMMKGEEEDDDDENLMESDGEEFEGDEESLEANNSLI